MATSSVKSQSTEARLNALVPKVPTPQTSPGAAVNSSYNDNDTYSGNPNTGGASTGTAHTHQTNLPQTTADKLNALAAAYNVLRNDHTNLLNHYNSLVTQLVNSGILH